MVNIRKNYAENYNPPRNEKDSFQDFEKLPILNPTVDIFEDDHTITMLAEMPGVSIENLSLDVKDDKLTLSGKVIHMKGKDEEAIALEYPMGKYYRRFKIPPSIDPEGLEAKLMDGLLTVKMKRKAKRSPRKIEITTS